MKALQQVEVACHDLAAHDLPVTFPAVAHATGISRATLYRNPELRAVVNDHRARQADAGTLTGLTREITHLRTTVEALAARIRNHEERIRHLEKPRTTRRTANGPTPD